MEDITKKNSPQFPQTKRPQVNTPQSDTVPSGQQVIGINEILSSTRRTLSSSHMLRIGYIGFLAMILMMPVGKIRNLVNKRTGRKEHASRDVASAWGKNRQIVGPILKIPYDHSSHSTVDNKLVDKIETRYLYLLPKKLDVKSSVQTQERHRGIFKIPVYTSQVQLTGNFSLPNIDDERAFHWDEMVLSTLVEDPRSLSANDAWTINGLPVEVSSGPDIPVTRPEKSFREYYPDQKKDYGGAHAALTKQHWRKSVSFGIDLHLKGHKAWEIAPVGSSTTVSLRSNWPHPKFVGNWLPDRHDITSAGFDASWSVSHLGRGTAESYTDRETLSSALGDTFFGVDINTPVDTYRMVLRSLKYAFLFIVMTFLILWLFQVLHQLKIHPIQYLLLGSALCIFFLLELALSEYLAFPLAYPCAAIPIVLLTTYYNLAVLKSWHRTLLLSTSMTALYGFLFVLLRESDFALLYGSIGVFIVLATVMIVTRRLNWYGLREQRLEAALTS